MNDYHDLVALRSQLQTTLASVVANPTVDSFYAGYVDAIAQGDKYNTETTREFRESADGTVARWLISKYADSLATSSVLLLSQADYVDLQGRIYTELVNSAEDESVKMFAVHSLTTNPYFTEADITSIVGKDGLKEHAKYLVDRLRDLIQKNASPEVVITDPAKSYKHLN